MACDRSQTDDRRPRLRFGTTPHQQAGSVAEPPAPAEVELRITSIAERVGLDAERIGLWAIARTAEWSLWSWEHDDTAEAARFHAWTQTLDVVIPES